MKIAASPLNENFAYCVYISNFNMTFITLIDKVDWVAKDVAVFGKMAPVNSSFCQRNRCTFHAGSTSVEFDFVNLCNCKYLIHSNSLFSTLATVFSRYHSNDMHLNTSYFPNGFFM